MKITSKEVLLTAFDRLFDRAANKLELEYSDEDRDEARRSFADRYEHALETLDEMGLGGIPESTMQRMEEAIDDLSPVQVAGYLATGPLALQMQKLARTLALRAAEQRLIEQLVASADDSYGGN